MIVAAKVPHDRADDCFRRSMVQEMFSQGVGSRFREKRVPCGWSLPDPAQRAGPTVSHPTQRGQTLTLFRRNLR